MHLKNAPPFLLLLFLNRSRRLICWSSKMLNQSGNEEDVEAVLEKTTKDFSPPLSLFCWGSLLQYAWKACYLFTQKLLKALFTLAGPDLQPDMAAISVCQSADKWTNTMNNPHFFKDHAVVEQLQYLPSAALFCVALEHGMRQISIMALISIHMRRITWLKVWTVETAYKRCLTCMPFQENNLFGEALNHGWKCHLPLQRVDIADV